MTETIDGGGMKPESKTYYGKRKSLPRLLPALVHIKAGQDNKKKPKK